MVNFKVVVDVWGVFGNLGWDWEILGFYYKKFYILVYLFDIVGKYFCFFYVDESVCGCDGFIKVFFFEEFKDFFLNVWVDIIGVLGFLVFGDFFSGKFFGGYVNVLSVDFELCICSDVVMVYFEFVKFCFNFYVVISVFVEKILFDIVGVSLKVVGV